MDLRAKLIEAGALHTGSRGMAADVLDAFLDCLAENADEWFGIWTDWQDEDGDPKFIGLLAVLRDSDV